MDYEYEYYKEYKFCQICGDCHSSEFIDSYLIVFNEIDVESCKMKLDELYDDTADIEEIRKTLKCEWVQICVCCFEKFTFSPHRFEHNIYQVILFPSSHKELEYYPLQMKKLIQQ